LTDTQTQTIA